MACIAAVGATAAPFVAGSRSVTRPARAGRVFATNATIKKTTAFQGERCCGAELRGA